MIGAAFFTPRLCRPNAGAATVATMKTSLISIIALVAAALSSAAVAATAASSVALEAPGPQGPLRGTLLVPSGHSLATVLIIPGSGPTDRDGNNPLGVRGSTYRLLAEGLAAHGIGTLRIDKRGLFGSASAVTDPNAVTISDYAADAHAWMAVLQKTTGAPCIWLLGHSEGGLVAMAAAVGRRDVCGLVLVSAPGRPLGEVFREQLKTNPANAPILPSAEAAIDALEHGRHVDTSGMHPALQRAFNPAVQGFLIDAFSYDPRRLVSGLKTPVLVVQGQRDLQVSEQDARLIHDADPDSTLLLLPDVNHVLKVVRSDSRQENMATYANADLPIAPDVVDDVAAFVTEHASGKGEGR